MTTIGAIQDVVGELLAAGTIDPATIPLAAAYTPDKLARLKAGDDDPLEVAVRIAPGQGGHGYYESTALRQLVEHVRAHTLAGYRGHTRSEDLPFRFEIPATHWIGAEWRADGAYFRGVVDKSDPDLKRLIRAERITQPSILTMPKVERRSDGRHIVGFERVFSIDWAPLGRAGMPSATVVGMGEIDDGQEGGDPAVTGQTTTTLTIKEHLAALRDQRATAHEVLGELAFPPRDVIPELKTPLQDLGPLVDADAWRDLQEDHRVVGELRAIVGGDPKPEQLLETIRTALGELAALRLEGRTAAYEAAIDRLEPKPSDAAKPLLLKEIAGELRDKGMPDEAGLDKVVGEMIGRDPIKTVLEALGEAPAPRKTTPAPHPQDNRRAPATAASGGLKPRWSSV